MESEYDNKKTIAEQEEETLRFWQENKIFEKSLTQTKDGELFIFYDGPPFATGLPHYGHILASIIKDVIPRYQTMRGRFVPRRWGWDCHGLPLENIIEQELGLQHKKDIEDYGIAKFNNAAENAVLRYADNWKEVIARIGRWVDMERDYRTMDWTYTESVWWVFKTLHEKKLIYEGHKSMHLCPRCETTLANFEVSQGYKDITDISVTVKFELEEEPGTFILAWTTTPWTLPGNVALAVSPRTMYVSIKYKESSSKEKYIVAKDRLAGMEGEYEVIEEFLGSELVGRRYKPLFDYYAKDEKLKNHGNGWKIYAADFVTTDEGTGIVHIAPAFGEDDMRLGKEYNLPFIQHVSTDGTFKPEVTDFVGLPVKPKEDHQKTDIEILKLLHTQGALFSKQKITHSYPFCWRCDTPLLNYAATSWFVDVTHLRGTLQRTAEEITWVPPHLKEGRFGKGLESAPDWAISRTRFWGAPLPVWKCARCEDEFVVGSLNDLEKNRARKPNTYILMRHGERQDIPRVKDIISEYGRIIVSSRPDVDVHISENGKADIREKAESLRGSSNGGVDAIFSSDFIRTRETAEIIAEVLGVPVTYDKRLRELNHGDEYEGRTVDEYWNYFSTQEERFTKTPPGGETLRDVRARVMAFVREFNRENEGKRVLMVSHGDPLWVLESALKNISEHEALIERERAYIKQGEVRECAMKNYPYDEMGRLNLHRPYSDEIILRCACGGDMKRVPEVFDCWFESGSMPYGQHHYIGKSVENFNPPAGEGIPADFIAEGLDQTRGWFYSLHVLAAALFESPAYTNVVVSGIILAEDGQKMSKRLKNYPDPMTMVEKYGADALRLYLLSSPAVYAEDLNFSEKGVDEMYKKVILRFQNVLSFYGQYATDDVAEPVFDETLHVLDKFMLYKLLQTGKEIKKALDTYRLDYATRSVVSFVNVLSTVYLQYSRDRFKEHADGYKQAIGSFRYILLQFAKLSAPVIPFLAEDVYQSIKTDGDAKESVHLEDWPSLSASFDAYTAAHKDVVTAQVVIEKILQLRSEAGILVRQPLSSATVARLPDNENICEIIRTRTNIECLIQGEEDLLDTTITPDLREKGMLREFVRGVQSARKKEGLKPKDYVTLSLTTNLEGKEFVERHADDIKKSVHAKHVVFTDENGEHAIKAGAVSFSIGLQKKV